MKTYHQKLPCLRFFRSIFGVLILNLVLILSTGQAVATNSVQEVELTPRVNEAYVVAIEE